MVVLTLSIITALTTINGTTLTPLLHKAC